MFSLANMKSKIEAAVAAVYVTGGTAPPALDAVMTATEEADKERLKKELAGSIVKGVAPGSGAAFFGYIPLGGTTVDWRSTGGKFLFNKTGAEDLTQYLKASEVASSGISHIIVGVLSHGPKAGKFADMVQIAGLTARLEAISHDPFTQLGATVAGGVAQAIGIEAAVTAARLEWRPWAGRGEGQIPLDTSTGMPTRVEAAAELFSAAQLGGGGPVGAVRVSQLEAIQMLTSGGRSHFPRKGDVPSQGAL